MANYITLNGVARTPWVEEALTISSDVVTITAAYAEGSLMVRARLEGGPVRMRFLGAPTATVGTPLYDGDVIEWTGPEITALEATGGLILGAAAGADAILWCVFYR